MSWETIRKQTRIRIQYLSIGSGLIAFLIAGLVAVLTAQLRHEFLAIHATTERYITCVNAAMQIQDGSNYLTEQVRLFTLNGAKEYLEHYFTEIDETQRRERALETLQEHFKDSDGLPYILSAMDYSQELTQTEYYAMRLVLEAADADPSDWPWELSDISLSEDDAALPKAEKISKAQQLVRNEAYQSSRNLISQGITAYCEILAAEIRDQQMLATAELKVKLRGLEHGTLLLFLMIFGDLWINYLLLVRPIAQGSKIVRRGEPLPERGAAELREMIAAYNAALEENQEVQRIIRREAEHDALTDLLNRRYFERTLLAYAQHKVPFALVIVDIDNFKTINDTLGHSIGDVVIKRVSSLLGSAFRVVDHVCRIGGDEFTVIVTDVVRKNGAAIQEKINCLNEELSIPADGVPSVSLSVGVAFADGDVEADKIFEQADQALYQVKKNGRCGCVIY